MLLTLLFLRHVGSYYVTLLLNYRANLYLVSVFPDVVKDYPKMRNLPKIFLRSFENVAPVDCCNKTHTKTRCRCGLTAVLSRVLNLHVLGFTLYQLRCHNLAIDFDRDNRFIYFVASTFIPGYITYVTAVQRMSLHVQLSRRDVRRNRAIQ